MKPDPWLIYRLSKLRRSDLRTRQKINEARSKLEVERAWTFWARAKARALITEPKPRLSLLFWAIELTPSLKLAIEPDWMAKKSINYSLNWVIEPWSSLEKRLDEPGAHRLGPAQAFSRFTEILTWDPGLWARA